MALVDARPSLQQVDGDRIGLLTRGRGDRPDADARALLALADDVIQHAVDQTVEAVPDCKIIGNGKDGGTTSAGAEDAPTK